MISVFQICNGDRQWSGTAPRCVPKVVNPIVSDQNAEPSVDKSPSNVNGGEFLGLKIRCVQSQLPTSKQLNPERV